MTFFYRNERGFTLIEMIVVLVVISLLVGLVVSHGPAHSERLDLDAVAGRVVGTLRQAHARAIAEERPVLVRFAPGGYRLDGGVILTFPSDVLLAGDQAISFGPDGGSSGGGVVLRAGQRRVPISVDWLTGRVGVAEAG